MSEFKDIEITDIDERLTERMDPIKAMFRVYFKLSAEAEPVWEQLF